MAKFTTSQVFIIASAAFLGGLVVSLFSSPQSGAENRRRLLNSTEDIKSKLKETGRDFKNKNLPDLYEATEKLGLTEDDLIPNG
jgi:gas vesicle protein